MAVPCKAKLWSCGGLPPGLPFGLWFSAFLLSATFSRVPGVAHALHSVNGAAGRELLALPSQPWSSPFLTLGVLWNGTVVATDKESGRIRWSFSSGAPLASSHGLLFENGEVSNATLGITGDLKSSDGKYYFCGNDWKLYQYDKRFGTENLPVSPDELIRSTPVILDGAVVLGSLTQTAFVVDANSGVLISRFDSGNGEIKVSREVNIQEDDIRRFLEPNMKRLHDVDSLFIFRTDYSLFSIATGSGELLWNVSIGELRIAYAKVDGVLMLPAANDASASGTSAHNRGLADDTSLQLVPAEVVSPFGSYLPSQHQKITDHLAAPLSIIKKADVEKTLTLSPLDRRKEDGLVPAISNGMTKGGLLRIFSFAYFMTLRRDWILGVLSALILVIIMVAFWIWRMYPFHRQDKRQKQLLGGKKKKVRKGTLHNDKVNGLKTEQPATDMPSLQERKLGDADEHAKAIGSDNAKIESSLNGSNISLMNGNRGKKYSEYGEGRWVGSLFVSNTVIGYGSHGTLVLEGYLDKRNVAVKRLLGQFYERAHKEISNLIVSDEHPNVVRCYAMEADTDFVYVALERCSFSLSDLILVQSSKNSISDVHSQDLGVKKLIAKVGEARNLTLWDGNGRPSPMLLQFMRDVVAGLAHLHDLGIVHRDLKPQNVLISSGRICCAKLSDMGISKRLVDDASSLDTLASGVGSSGWQAPEQLLSQRQTRAVDLFSLGCVLFYCLSGGNHPFGPHFERDRNILNGQRDLFLVEHIPEATHLLSSLSDSDPRKRPSAKEVLLHPLFWSPEKRLSFLRDASDRVELENRVQQSFVLDALEAVAPVALGGAWDEKLESTFLENLGHYRRYNFRCVRDLLRVIRNKSSHYRELPQDVQQLVGPMPEGYEAYFRNRFPSLLLEVYKILCCHCRGEIVFQPYFT
eukprot:c22883_g1_i2 orf=134-2890(+)